MKIVDIFVIVKDSLYAVFYDTESQDAYRGLFNRWQDVEYLEQFFEDHKSDLQSGFFGNISVEYAVLQTLQEAARFDQLICLAATQGTLDQEQSFEKFAFQPLHEDVLSNTHIQSKAYGPHNKSWLRIYAIRISSQLYVVSGGAIKLTKDMTPPHLEQEIKKLKATASYLKDLGLIDEDDIGYIEIGNDEED